MAEGTTSTPAGWRFGRFELRPAQRRLLRDGAVVNVEERAFDLLVLLAANHERELDRREITEALWGRRPVSDNTLRQALYKARRAVDDDGDQQAVLRTLHGRSLRWVAPLQVVESATPPIEVVPRPTPTPRRRTCWWLAAGAALALVALATAWLNQAHAPEEGALPRLAIEPITNATGDAALDWTTNGLPGLLAGLLGQAGGVDVVDPLQSARVWKYRPQQGRDQEQQLRFVTGADIVVGGRLRKLAGELYELDLRVTSGDGRPVALAVSGTKPGVIAANAVTRVRRVLKLEPRVELAALPHDSFLAEAYARGMDQAEHGNWKQAGEFFKLVAEGAPRFLNGRLNLGIAQIFTDDVAAGKRTFAALAVAARQQNDSRAEMLAMLWQARLKRDYDAPATAIADLRAVVQMAQHAQDAEVEIEARAMLADVLYKVGQHDAARQELATGAKLGTVNPQLLNARAVLYDIESEVANGDGDLGTALTVAQKVLALRESMGDRRGVLVSKFYVGQALYSQGKDADALTLAGRAWRDATAAGDLEMRYSLGALAAAAMLDLGLDRDVQAAALRLDQMAQRLGSNENRLIALQLGALAAMQRNDFPTALKSLRDGAALVDQDKLGRDDYFSQILYTALATYVADPHALPALLSAYEARQAVFGSDKSYPVRRLQLQALAVAATGQTRRALELLRQASGLPGAAADKDVERRMAPLLIALATGDADMARFALDGYAPLTTSDANILPTGIRWLEAKGDHAAADAARAHLAALRARGQTALAAAGLDPDDPFRDAAATDGTLPSYQRIATAH